MYISVSMLGVGRYRYQIFNTVDTRLRADGIDTCKQNRCVSIPARAAHTVCGHALYAYCGGDSEAGSFSLILGGTSVSPVTAEK